MKSIFLLLGLIIAATIMLVSFSGEAEKAQPDSLPVVLSPQYKWTMVAPPGSGTHQYEWKPGTYPSAIEPLIAFNDELWMVGQRKAWSSKDGIKWSAYDKHDWGERISMTHVYFKDTYWITGGMDYATNTFLNEIWSSPDGKSWKRTVLHAEWSPRKNHSVVAFGNKLWLFGGETSVDKDRVPDKFVNDVWSSDDGIHWNKILDQAPWETRGSPRFVVFKDKLWLVGGQGRSDVWNSDDGIHWTKVADNSDWNDRYDYGLIAFDNLIWIYGGREKNPRNAYNDAWFSPNGINWIQQTSQAPWTKRSGGFSVAFHNKLFLYGGKHTGHEDGFSGDIWTLEKL